VGAVERGGGGCGEQNLICENHVTIITVSLPPKIVHLSSGLTRYYKLSVSETLAF